MAERRKRGLKKHDKKKKIRGNMLLVARVGVRDAVDWFLSDRSVEKNSAIRVPVEDVLSSSPFKVRPKHAFSTFLDTRHIVGKKKNLQFSIGLSVSVDRYLVEGWGWLNDIDPNERFYQNTIFIELKKPKDPEQWVVSAGEGSRETGLATYDLQKTNGVYSVRIPFGSPAHRPGIDGVLHLHAKPWN
jgi:hypothetical protein